MSSCLIIAQREARAIDTHKCAVVVETTTNRHIVSNGIGYHRANLHIVAQRGDILQHKQLVLVVIVSRVRGCTAKYPLTLWHEDITHLHQTSASTTLLTHLLIRRGCSHTTLRHGIHRTKERDKQYYNLCSHQFLLLVSCRREGDQTRPAYAIIGG